MELGAKLNRSVFIRFGQLNKVGEWGKVYTTSIPSVIRQLFDVKADDNIVWRVNIETGLAEICFTSRLTPHKAKFLSEEGREILEALLNVKSDSVRDKMLETALKELAKKKSDKVKS